MMVDTNGIEHFMPPLLVVESTDFQTQCKIYSRSDGLIIVTHLDGTQVVKHHDGTTMIRREMDVKIENPLFATVTAHTDTQGFTVLMPDATLIEKTNDADTGSTIITLTKMSGEQKRAELVVSSSEKLVSVYPTPQAKVDGTPHTFDLTIGAFSNIDCQGNAFRSGWDDLGAAVDLYRDPALDEQALAEDLAATVARVIFVLGPPRSGKTTSCEYLKSRHGHTVVDMDFLIREALAVEMPDEGWPPGSLLKEIQAISDAAGTAVPVYSADILTKLLFLRISQEDCTPENGGYVLDGYPRSQEEADALRAHGITAQRVIMLKCSTEACHNRADGDMIVVPEGADMSPHDAAMANWEKHGSVLSQIFSGMLTEVDASPPFAPGRPSQSYDKMLAAAKASISPANFGKFRPQIALTGVPGSGCSEQCKRLQASYGLVVINLKDLSKKDGSFLPDAAAVEKIKNTISDPKGLAAMYGWVVDGWPRTVAQVEACKNAGIKFQKIIMLGDLDDEEAARRLTAAAGGGEANENMAKAKIEVFNEGKDDFISYFEGNSQLVIVDAGSTSKPLPDPSTLPPLKKGELPPPPPKATPAEVEVRVKTTGAEVALHDANTEHLPRIFMLGAPGSGKTDQCRVISAAYDCVSINMTVLMQEAAESDTSEVGKECKRIVSENGKWKDVSDEVLIKLFTRRISQDDCLKRGYIVDAFPRNGAQAEAMRELGVAPRAVILLEISEELVVERCTGRRFDPLHSKWDGTGWYHLKFDPRPDIDTYERLEQQPVDWEESTREALESFGEGIEELKELYDTKLKKIDGSKSRSEILADVIDVLPSKPSPSPPLPAVEEPLPHASERLFVIHEDGSGFELLTRSNVESYIAQKSKDHATTIVKEAVVGDEKSECYTFFTQSIHDRFPTAASGEGNILPKILAPLENPRGKTGRCYEYRQFLIHPQPTENELYTLKKGLQKRVADAAQHPQNNEVVVDMRTVDEREAELAMQARLKTLMRPNDKSEADAVGAHNRALDSSHSTRAIKTPGGSIRRVKFDIEAAGKKVVPGKKDKGKSKGLRPSFPMHRQDLLQYPQFTNYFQGEAGAEFQSTQKSSNLHPPGSPVAPGQMYPALPPGTALSQMGNGNIGVAPGNIDVRHPFEEAVPLPRTSNMQVLDPINPHETWDHAKPPAGTRGMGVKPPLGLDGAPRINKIPMPETFKFQPASEPNERYQAIEDPVRRNNKTMSAFNLNMGGVGVGGRDPTRGFLVHPQELKFGRVQADKMYQLRITLMNGGIDSSRFQVRKPKGVDVRYKTGMVAAGMSIPLQVIFSANTTSAVGNEFDEELQIVTENEVFRIPLRASILNPKEFESLPVGLRTNAPEYVAQPKGPQVPRNAPVSESPTSPGEFSEGVYADEV